MTATRREIERIFREVLDVAELVLENTFEENGGDSLAAIIIANDLHDLFDIDTEGELLLAVTEPVALIDVISATERLISALLKRPNRSIATTLDRMPVPDAQSPLLPEQAWFISTAMARLEEPHHWNDSRLMAVRRPIDVAKLADALAQLWSRHTALRTRISYGLAPRASAAEWTPPLEIVDVSRHRLLSDTDATVQAATEVDASLDLNGVLARPALIVGRGKTSLLIAAHHLVADAISMENLTRELEQLLTGQGLPAAPPDSFQWSSALWSVADGMARPGGEHFPQLPRSSIATEVATVDLDEITKGRLSQALTETQLQFRELLLVAATNVPALLGLGPAVVREVQNGRTTFSGLTKLDSARTVGRLAVRSVVAPAPTSTPSRTIGEIIELVEWLRAGGNSSSGALVEWRHGPAAGLDVSVNFLAANPPAHANRLFVPMVGYRGRVSDRNHAAHDVELIAGSWTPRRATVVVDPETVGAGSAAAIAECVKQLALTLVGSRSS